jgi:hypothetical protein
MQKKSKKSFRWQILIGDVDGRNSITLNVRCGMGVMLGVELDGPRLA